MRKSPSRGAAFALLFTNLLILIATYIFFVRTVTGQSLEQFVLNESDYSTTPTMPLGLVEPSFIVLVLLFLAALVWWRGGKAKAVYVWLIVGTLLVATQLLKMWLPRPALLAVDPQFLENTFPSGHMGVFVILGLLFVTVTNDNYQRTVFWIVAAVNAVVIWQLLDNGWHRPSDLVAAISFSVFIFSAYAFLAPRLVFFGGSLFSNHAKPFARIISTIVLAAFWLVTAVILIKTVSEQKYAIAFSFLIVLIVFIFNYRSAVSVVKLK